MTGGARGLGTSIVRAIAAQGAKVIVNYRRSEEAARRLVTEIGADRAVALQADVTDGGLVEQLLIQAEQQFGTPVTTVVNNALADFSFNVMPAPSRTQSHGLISTRNCAAP